MSAVKPRLTCDSQLILIFYHPHTTGQVKELLDWAKKAKPLAKVGLALASIALKVCTGLAIPTTDFEAALGTQAGGALSDFVKEALDSGIETLASVAEEGLGGDSPARGPWMQNVRAY